MTQERVFSSSWTEYEWKFVLLHQIDRWECNDILLEQMARNNKQKIIYLDQFAASKMVDEEGLWKEAKDLLVEAVNRHKVICPIPMEHYVETGGRNREFAIKQDDFFRSISGGKRFRFWEEIVADEIMYYTKFKNNKPKYSTYLRNLDDYYDFKDEDFYDSLLKLKQEYTKMKEEEKEAVNQIRKIIRDVNSNKSEKESEIKCKDGIKEMAKTKKQNAEIMQKALPFTIAKSYVDTFRGIAAGDKLPGNTMVIQCHKSQRIAFLLCLKRFTGFNFYSASKEFEKNAFRNIPSLNTYYGLQFFYALNQMNESINDDVDLERISSGIVISDIMFTDKRQKYRIEQLGLDKQYKTLLFSANDVDIKSFINEMKRIIEW